MRVLLPKAFVGLIGHVPMVKAVAAFVKFFNSAAVEGAAMTLVTFLSFSFPAPVGQI